MTGWNRLCHAALPLSDPELVGSNPGIPGSYPISRLPVQNYLTVTPVRRRRRAAATVYQPENVRLLLVAQAPPDADDRYFYFPEVAQHDWLFRAVARAMLTPTCPEPTRPPCWGDYATAGCS